MIQHHIDDIRHYAVGNNEERVLLQLQDDVSPGKVDQIRLALTAKQAEHVVELLKDAILYMRANGPTQTRTLMRAMHNAYASSVANPDMIDRYRRYLNDSVDEPGEPEAFEPWLSSFGKAQDPTH